MHNEEYIASGILELYAAGGLMQEEREEVERRAADSPEIRAALNEACAAMEAYANLYAVPPRPELKDKIMSQIRSSVTEASPEAKTRSIYTAVETGQKERSPFKWLFAASVALLLAFGFLSFYFYSKWQQAEVRLQSVIASEQRLAQEYNTVSAKMEQQEGALALLRNPDLNIIRLRGVESNPGASLTVYWSPKQEQVYVSNINLPQPPAGKQYQLWALNNGSPIDAGMITLASGTPQLQQMKRISSAQAFAVTLEPEGGSENPTLEQLTVMGKIDS